MRTKWQNSSPSAHNQPLLSLDWIWLCLIECWHAGVPSLPNIELFGCHCCQWWRVRRWIPPRIQRYQQHSSMGLLGGLKPQLFIKTLVLSWEVEPEWGSSPSSSCDLPKQEKEEAKGGERRSRTRSWSTAGKTLKASWSFESLLGDWPSDWWVTMDRGG